MLPSVVGAGWSQWFIHQEVVDTRRPARSRSRSASTTTTPATSTSMPSRSRPSVTSRRPAEGRLIRATFQAPARTPAGTRWATRSSSRRRRRRATPYEAEAGFSANGAVARRHPRRDRPVDLSAARARLVVTTFATDDRAQLVTLRYRSTPRRARAPRRRADGSPSACSPCPPRPRGERSPFRSRCAAGSARSSCGARGRRRRRARHRRRAVSSEARRRNDRGATTWHHRRMRPSTASRTAQILAPSRTFRELAAEASGRQAVTLAETDDAIELDADRAR